LKLPSSGVCVDPASCRDMTRFLKMARTTLPERLFRIGSALVSELADAFGERQPHLMDLAEIVSF